MLKPIESLSFLSSVSDADVRDFETALEKERARVAKLIAEVEQRDSQIGDMIRVVNKAIRDAMDSRAVTSALEARLQALSEQAKELDAVKREWLDVKKENNRMRGELEKSHSRAAELRLEVEALRVARRNLSGEIESLKCVVAELEVALRNKRTVIADLKRDGAHRSANDITPTLLVAEDANDETGVYSVQSGTLVAQDGRHQEYPLGKPTIIVGRSSNCDIRIGGSHTSRHHARLVSDRDGTTIEDLDSINGVRVNSANVKSYRLRDGDTVQIGENLFKFFDAREIHESPSFSPGMGSGTSLLA